MTITEQGDKQKEQKLTQKQEDFARAFIESATAAEAYRKVYNVSPDCKASTIHRRAHDLTQDGKIAARIKELQDRAAVKVVLDRSWVLERLMRNADKAIELEDVNGSNKALELLGKTKELGGMFVDKVESTSTVTSNMTVSTVDAPPTETREEWLARRQRELARNAQAVVATARTTN